MDKITKQNALNAHSWVGIFLSVILFLVCFSGTVAVFHQEFERWEQPQIPEMSSIAPEMLDKAMNTFLQKHPEQTDHLFVVFPTSGIPRFVVENDDKAYFADSNGSLLEVERSPFTKMMVDLHLYLNLPHAWGMILVSAMGAIICTLVVTGIVAHKRITKDAFRLRRGGNGQQYTIDLHNRFGLWAAPFHLIIGVTGAYFGLAGLLIVLVSSLYYGGDRDAVVAEIFTPDPVMEQPYEQPQLSKAFAQMANIAPNHEPIFLTVHEAYSDDQFIEIYAKAPGKMIYSENYRFDSAGDFIGTGGYEDGHWGKQLVYAMYRLHFGDFAGLSSKILYFVLGVMLTVLCISGTEIWLQKKANPPVLTRVWQGIVWGSIGALALTAMVSLAKDTGLVSVFWGLVLLNSLLSVFIDKCDKRFWLVTSGICVLLLLVSYTFVHGASAFSIAALQLNIPMLAYVVWSFYRGRSIKPHQESLNQS